MRTYTNHSTIYAGRQCPAEVLIVPRDGRNDISDEPSGLRVYGLSVRMPQNFNSDACKTRFISYIQIASSPPRRGLAMTGIFLCCRKLLPTALVEELVYGGCQHMLRFINNMT